MDSLTVLVAISTAMGFIGLALLLFWLRERETGWLLWWAVPFFSAAVGAFIYMVPNWQFNAISITFGNVLRILALCLLWQGARVFARKRPLWWVLPATAAAWLALCLVPAFFESLAARVVAGSAFNALFAGLAAHELWRCRGENLPSIPPAALVFVSFAVLMLVRIVAVDLLPFPMGARPLDPVWMALFNLLVFAHATFLGFLVIALSRERREAEQRQYALLDPLTGLLNRRAFMGQVERYRRRPRLGRTPTAVLVLDLDHFKSVNDRFGHVAGDRVLQAFAAAAEASVRPMDQLYRLGGEEFCLVLPDTSLSEAIDIAERIRRHVAEMNVEGSWGRASITVSIGVASSTRGAVNLEALHAAADAAAYEAKARGRNCVAVSDVVTPMPQPERRRA